jgi:hypothetical protein
MHEYGLLICMPQEFPSRAKITAPPGSERP